MQNLDLPDYARREVIDADHIWYTIWKISISANAVWYKYGIRSIFQRTMEQLFTGYPCEIIVYDILVWGHDIAEHDYNLEKVLQRAKEVNLKLSTKKCKLRLESVSYVVVN